MYAVISPAKKLNFETPAPVKKSTQLKFQDEAYELIKNLRKRSPDEISKLMKLSESLTKLNVDRYKKYEKEFHQENSKQALFAFAGDTYVGLDAESLDKKNIDFAQKHLGILSGLYGLARPLDLIQPYRLEMGTRLAVGECENLYQYWGEILTKELNKILKKEKYLINLASNEYFSVIRTENLKGEIITPIFKEKKGDQYKVVGISAKRARGMMARFMIENQIEDPQALKEFHESGYSFNKTLSTDYEYVFTRSKK